MKILLTLTLLAVVTMFAHNCRSDEVNCLALNIYHEARNQPTVGKLAVAMVTLNRVKDERFPNTIYNFPIKIQVFLKSYSPSPFKS